LCPSLNSAASYCPHQSKLHQATGHHETETGREEEAEGPEVIRYYHYSYWNTCTSTILLIALY